MLHELAILLRKPVSNKPTIVRLMATAISTSRFVHMNSFPTHIPQHCTNTSNVVEQRRSNKSGELGTEDGFSVREDV